MNSFPAGVPVLRVLVGPPGAGKSTWCRQHADALGVVLSLDAARAEVGAGEEDQAATPAAVDLVRQRARRHLIAGEHVVVDATGAAADPDRATWLALAREVHAEPVATIFRAPLGTCLRRNALRSRTVDSPVIVQMWLAIQNIADNDLYREGFTRVSEAHPSPEQPGSDPRDWRHAVELEPGMPIWHPSPRENDEACLDVLAVSDVDDDGLVTIYTRQSAPVQISADWGIGLFTAADGDLVSYLAVTEQDRWEGER